MFPAGFLELSDYTLSYWTLAPSLPLLNCILMANKRIFRSLHGGPSTALLYSTFIMASNAAVHNTRPDGQRLAGSSGVQQASRQSHCTVQPVECTTRVKTVFLNISSSKLTNFLDVL